MCCDCEQASVVVVSRQRLSHVFISTGINSIKYIVSRMFTRLLFCLIIVLAIISLTTADFSCFFGDFLCKQVACRGCTFSACINSECTCKFCS
uniref:Uncharacterized protein n=1 Tax=Angiostrongylus cantonensis TaxID=6313 RepID=A0A0K0DQR5_ANGCA